MAAGSGKNRVLYLLFVLPLAIVAVYLYLFASDVYVSEAKFLIQKDSDNQAPELALGILAAASGTAASRPDSLLISDLIESMGMFSHLQQELGVKAHYSDTAYDFYSRLAADASQEEFYDYYSDHVEVLVDDMSSVVTVTIKAFSPDVAQQMNQAILAKSERFVNDIGQSLAKEQVAFMEEQLIEAEQRVNKANETMLQVQNRHRLLSPEAEAASLGEIIGSLESELAMRQAELKQLQTFLNPKAPEVVSLKARVQALQGQVASERRRQTGKSTSESEALNEASVAFQNAQQELQFALGMYQSALSSLENARLDASRKVKYLVVVSPPSLPEEAQYPRKLYILITLAIVLLLLYGIARLTIATIEDHRE